MAEEQKKGERPNAWLLDFGQTLHAAVGLRTLLQVVDGPRLQHVPCSPAHCHSVFAWQGRLLPVLDMAVLLGSQPQRPYLLAVAAYQEHPDAPTRFGALLLTTPPVGIVVGNDQACPLPEQPAAWSKLAISCFGHQGDAIPVLHMGRIFSRRTDLQG